MLFLHYISSLLGGLMQASNMDFVFGKYQFHTSDKLSRYPLLSKVVTGLFGYTNLGNYARSRIFIKLLKQLPVEQFNNILDLGCGYGEYSFMLADAFPKCRITALDIDQDRIQTVKKAIDEVGMSNIRTVNHFLEKEPIEETYDFIFSIDVFEHIQESQMPFAAAYERLKPGGYMMVKIPNVTQKTIFPDHWFEEHHEWLDEEHIGQIYDLEGLRKRFTQEGFEIVHASYSDGWLSRLGWELAYLTKKGGYIPQLTFLPIAKTLVHLDHALHRGKSGNAIQVIGRKPS